MEVRKVNDTDDFNAIGNIYSQSWKIAYQGIVPQGYLDDLNGSLWSSALAERADNVYVIMNQNQYIGTASICAARDVTMTGWGEIRSIYLLPEYFGQGYAKPLFDYAINGLIEKNLKNIYLWVLAGNTRARKFYEKNGFVPNGDSAAITIGNKELTEIKYIKHLQ